MRTTFKLMEGWEFSFVEGQEDHSIPEASAWEAVSLPHVYNVTEPSKAYQALYRKSFSVTEEQKNGAAFISFGAVGVVAKAWLNGIYLGEHRGAYSAFSFELTDALIAGENVLTVFCDNNRYDDVCPLMGDFDLFGGIYRDVELIFTEREHFDLLYYGSSGIDVETEANGKVRVLARMIGEDLKVRYTLLEGETAVKQVVSDTQKTEFTLEDPKLWDGLEAPNVYTLKAELLKDEEAVDEVSLEIGFRSFSVDPKKGFILNGRSYPLHGVAKHQDRFGHGAEFKKEYVDEDMALISEIGANTVRFSHYQHPQYTYALCDRSGVVVWAEIPMLHMPDGNDAVMENAKMQMTELILQNKHHPSICFWGVANEVGMLGETAPKYEKMKLLSDLAHQLDPTRLTVAANENSTDNSSLFNFQTDVVSYNRYYGWYYGEMEDFPAFLDRFHRDNPNRPLAISEYGVDCSTALHSLTPKRKDYSEDFQAAFHEYYYPCMAERPFVWGSFIWNMFDFSSSRRNEGGMRGENKKGLVTSDRKTKKDAFYYYKAQWQKAPFVHVAGEHFVKRHGEKITVKLYGNADEAELYVNGESIGKEKFAGGISLFKDIEMPYGLNTIRAVTKDAEDTLTIEHVKEVEKSYIYVDPNPEINVRNWVSPEETEEKLFPEGYYSIRDNMCDLFKVPEIKELLYKELPIVMANPRMNPDNPPKMPLLRMINFVSGKLKEEDIKALNAKLTKIHK